MLLSMFVTWFVTLWKSSFPRNPPTLRKLLPLNPPPSEFPIVFRGGGMDIFWNHTFSIHVQYSDIMRFLVRHNRHHKVSRSSYVTKLLLFCEELGWGGYFVMPIQCPRNLIKRVYWTTLVFRHCTYWRQILWVGCQWEPSTSEVELATFHIFKGKPLKKGIWQKRLCL